MLNYKSTHNYVIKPRKKQHPNNIANSSKHFNKNKNTSLNYTEQT